MPETEVNLADDRRAYLEALVSRARTAAAVFTQYTQEDVDRIVKPMVIAGMENAQRLAKLAVEETRFGVPEDKAIKNMVATEFVYDYIRDKRTVGVIREFPERGLSRSGRTDGRDPLPDSRHESDGDGAVQVHHGDQDAERADLRAASGVVAMFDRAAVEDHVRDGGEARRTGGRLLLDRVPHGGR